MLQVLKRLEDGSELAGAEILVKSVGEAFEVDIGCVHVPKKFGPWFGRNIAGTDSYCLDTPPTTGLRHIDRIFKKDHRVVVSKSDRSAATSHRGLCNHLRRGHILNAIKIPSLRDVPVLAEFAGQVAAGSSKRQDRRTRQEVIERLLFNRVDAKARRAAICGEHQLVASPRA